MRTLVVTPFPPPGPQDVQALFRRLGLFVRALGMVCDEVEMLHYVPAGHPAFAVDHRRLDEAQSTRWGTTVTVALAAARPAQRSAASLALTVVSAFSHPAYRPFTGRYQTAALEQCLDRRPDIVLVHRLLGIGPLLRIRQPLPPILFDLDDVEHRVKIRAAVSARSWLAKAPRLAQAPALLAAERRAIAMATRTFVCSDKDRSYLKGWGLAGIVTVPNAVSIPSEPLPVAPDKTVMLIGAFHYRPNVEAAERLISMIWPLVRRQVPQATLIIAGSAPESIPAFQRRPAGVEFTGLVDDLGALYRRTRVVCCPLSNGGGTRLKLVEAAAHARPMVSTAVGAEGLSFKNDAAILIREDDRAIADACIGLLHDDGRCAMLGLAAYRTVREAYDRNAVEMLIATEARRVLGLGEGAAFDRPASARVALTPINRVSS